MNPIILIPARLGSTRLPNKPLADIHGLPMIVHVWQRAMEADIGQVYVACDDIRIQEAIGQAGGKAVMTRANHPSGSDRIFEALGIIDADKHHDIVINVQGDVPTIEPETIRAVLEPLNHSPADIATLACEIKDEMERSDPSIVKIVGSGQWAVGDKKRNDCEPQTANILRALYFSRAAIPYGDGPLYHHIGIYAYRRAALEHFVTLPPSPLEKREKLEQLRALEAGMRIDVALVSAVPLGVDTQEQLEKARELLRR